MDLLNFVPDFLSNWITWVVAVPIMIIIKGVQFVPQNRGYVIYTLGKYNRTLGSGLGFVLPFIEKIAADRNLKETAFDVNQQTAITKDNITLQIDGVLFIKVVDAASATNAVTDYKSAVIQLAMTTMRNAIGSMELDECFQKRDEINAKILGAMAEATQPWGVQVTRYEIKDIVPPNSIKEDMEKQMSAEREKRSVILEAEGYKASEIAKAEGEKQAKILQAEAAKQEQVLKAQAKKESQILIAEGEARSITVVADSRASALETVGEKAATANGQKAVQYELAGEVIKAHAKIADEGTVVLSDGKTGENISTTLAQALAVTQAVETKKTQGE